MVGFIICVSRTIARYGYENYDTQKLIYMLCNGWAG